MGGNSGRRDARTRGIRAEVDRPRRQRPGRPAPKPAPVCELERILARRARDRGSVLEMRGFGVQPWPPGLLTYSIGRLSAQVAAHTLLQMVRACFDQWQAIGILRFQQVPAGGTLQLSWVTGDHDDGFSFRPSVRTFGHAFGPGMADPPLLGQVHFNDAEKWQTSPSGDGTDLMSIVVHEVGHALGITSVSDPNAVMSEDFSRPRLRRVLTPLDIQALRSLYEA